MKSDMTNNTDDDLPIPLPPVYIGWPRWVVRLIEYLAGPRGEYYHSHWMSMHRIPPVPLWSIQWFLDLGNWRSGPRQQSRR
jgi:hypothetical protein